MEIMNAYYEISKNFLDNYEIKKRNYQVLNNIKEIIENNSFYKQLEKINQDTDIKDKMIDIMDLIYLINKEKLNQIRMTYYIKDKDNIKILGKEFIENNKNNCYIFIDGKKVELSQYLKLEKSDRNTLEITLIETKPITNLYCMFYDCDSLLYLEEFDNLDTKNITNMSYLFSRCELLKSLPDISKWDTKKVIDMDEMFSYCSSLKILPDISKWNTKSVINMNGMFLNCSSLKSLPDISKWNTKNVTKMSGMFMNCRSLESFPDISKWNMNNDPFKTMMFTGVDKKIIPEKFKGCLIY